MENSKSKVLLFILGWFVFVTTMSVVIKKHSESIHDVNKKPMVTEVSTDILTTFMSGEKITPIQRSLMDLMLKQFRDCVPFKQGIHEIIQLANKLNAVDSDIFAATLFAVLHSECQDMRDVAFKAYNLRTVDGDTGPRSPKALNDWIDDEMCQLLNLRS